ncbi:GNAT family N-acetyltransferase [Streptomyces sp. ICBB 8177]|uniref:GNAT family N-acetyltransferase n=1 Tax=Streptomyces sp. ICBB 8177 TaxID=563922 RepID=UPI000D681AFD|nr:GNAT family N-acetyltransferase [Streptomyces sp. ICBB 8177]PWI42605.1 GNAT family N-acetyltransferase [Streptomyces sp. ICBB 8177]
MNQVTGIDVRTAGRSDVRETAAVLARAFDDDPVMAWMFPDAEERPRRLPGLFSVLLRHQHLRHGAVRLGVDGAGARAFSAHSTAADSLSARRDKGPATRRNKRSRPPIQGAALWDPPGQWRNPAWRELLALPGYARLFGRRLAVAGETVATLAAAHPEEPHWYLAVLGTEPAAQGRGVGAVLLRSRLEVCDREGTPAYLESSKDRNVPYYERFGFRVTGEITIPHGGPTTWAMWRIPQG